MIPRLTELEPASAKTLAFLDELRRGGFRGDLADDLATRVVGATDNSIYQILPQAIVYPRTREDVVLLLRTAAREAYRDLALTARGGGTGTNGQSLTSGIVVDLGRHMNRIGAREGDVVEVEPGVVLDQLNAALAPAGVFFAPNLSPSSRATIGGMISTDACGQGSRVYGKTSQHVSALEVVLSDGSVLRTRPLKKEEALALPAWDADAPLAERLPRAVLELALRVRDDFVAKLPRLHRFLTGYNLERAYDPVAETLDLKWLVTGAEGTLGIVTRAWLGVVPIPTARRLAVLEFPSFEAALSSAEIVIARDPSSIETVDERVMDLAREDVIFPAVAAYLPSRPAPFPKTAAINLVEFEGSDAAAVEAKIQELVLACEQHEGEPGWPMAWSVARTDADRNALWQLRAKGVGLLGNTKGRRKPVPFVEDTVVPPEKLAAYVAEFRAVLDAEGLTYGMFGHVDVGCLHVRPALDLRDPEDEARVRRISDRVAALCTKYGGVIWGEHGKGFRSEYSPLHFGDLFVHVEKVKELFDPDERLNPGKIATPPGKRRHLATIDQPTRGQQDRQIARAAQDAFTLAIDCNGNGQCFHWDPDHVMCPSSKVTRDRIHTPKGRAGVMREWLRQLSNAKGPLPGVEPAPGALRTALTTPVRALHTLAKGLGQFDYSHEVNRAMQGCLACKACATQCPVKVDVPAFRSEFLQSYHTRYLRPVRDHLVAGLEGALAFMAFAPWFFNFFLRSSIFQRVFGRLSGLVDTPLLAPRPLRALLRDRDIPVLGPGGLAEPEPTSKKERVVLVQDAFTSFYEPELVLTVRDLLVRLGCEVHVARYEPNGKGLHVKGFLRAFERRARKTAARLKELAASGATLVAIEPAVGLTYRDEYRHALGKDLGFEVSLLQELLVRVVPKGSGEKAPGPRYRLFGHCTEKTLAPASQKQWADVFARLGLGLDLVATGCCGMSGAFGHERVHRDESKGIWELSWERWLGEDPSLVLATGYSCRSQAHRFGKIAPRHPAEVLLAHLSAKSA